MKRRNLINERKDKQLTQAATAKFAGITARQYARLEAGTSGGSIKVWFKLSDLFHKPIDYLLEQAVTNTISYVESNTKAAGRSIREINKKE